MSKIIASTFIMIVVSIFSLQSVFAAQNVKGFFAHEKRKEDAKKERIKFADQATKAREKANRRKVGAADRYIAKRKKILKKKAKREALFKKNEDKRKAREDQKIKRALKQAEAKRSNSLKSLIPPDREYGIKVMPVKNAPGIKKSRKNKSVRKGFF